VNIDIDLHIHSSHSDDGEFTPADLVRQCKEAGIRLMSITDHNSARANAEAKKEAISQGISYISGIEIDCTFQGTNLHLLGYGIDDTSPDFEELKKHILTGERNASMERLALTRQLGLEVSEVELNTIFDINDETGFWTGETFAEALLKKPELIDHELLLPYRSSGEKGDSPFVNFYWDFYSQGKPCYVEVDFPEIKEAIAIIKDNGGIAVLAHPYVNLKERIELFDKIAEAYIDGVEVFCSYHDEKAAHYFYEQALKYSLLITCGSDYHGKFKPTVKLGESGCWLQRHIIANQFHAY